MGPFHVLILLAAFSGMASAKRVGGHVNQKTCAVPVLQKVCECDKTSKKGNQCSGCKSKMKWGYGCDLDCPESCGENGCDFAGNCNTKSEAKQNARCKRNSRIKATEGKLTTFEALFAKLVAESVRNSRGECAACERGSYGVDCEKRCSTLSPNFVETAEGTCTRGGRGYACADRFFGESCNSKCPSACSKCVMRDNLIKQEGSDAYLPAGACMDQCKKGTWGMSCENKCSSNCKKNSKSGFPECDKATGKCHQCGENEDKEPRKDHQWWGDECNTKCSDGCVDFQCKQETGHCRPQPKVSSTSDAARKLPEDFQQHGIRKGYCGNAGEQQCPEGFVGGCNAQTCMPDACVEGKYPGFVNGSPGCVGCPAMCAKPICSKDGSCDGCKSGWMSRQCEKKCPEGCDGSCDQNTGLCKKCKAGFTGKRCTKMCHKTCATCSQTGDATGPNACLTCPDDHPSKLKKDSGPTSCVCVDGASVSPTSGVCECGSDEPGMVSFFQADPKSCKIKCEDRYKIVYGDMMAKCFTGKIYKAVVKAEDHIKASCPDFPLAMENMTEPCAPEAQLDCDEGEYSIPVEGQSEGECIREAFILYILKE